MKFHLVPRRGAFQIYRQAIHLQCRFGGVTTNPSTTSSRTRILTLDILKAWAIFGVVAIHAFTLREGDPWAGAVMAYFRFGVPIFIIIAFYLACRRLAVRGEDAAVFVKRMLRLLIPYFFYSLLYHFLFHSHRDWDAVQILKTNIGGYSWPGQYYLVVLVQLTLIYYAVQAFLHRLNLIAAIIFSAGVFVFFTVPLSYLQLSHAASRINMSLFVYYLPYFFWGCALAFAVVRSHVPAWALPITLLLLLFAPLLIVLESKLALFDPFTYSTLACIVAAFVMSWLAISSEEALTGLLPAPMQRGIILISEHTLGIYCLNPLAIYFLAGHLLPVLAFLPEVIALSAITIAAFALCLFASILAGNLPGFNYLTK